MDSQETITVFLIQKVKQLEKENEELKQKIKELETPKQNLSKCQACCNGTGPLTMVWDEHYDMALDVCKECAKHYL